MDLKRLGPRHRALLARLGVDGGGGPRIPRRGTGDKSPMSFGQERLWFIDRLQPGQAMYTMAGMVGLPAPCDLAALGKAIDHLVHRHEALRTRFAVVDGRPSQLVQPPSPVPIAVTDLRGAAPERVDALAQRAVRRETEAPFELEAGRLLRVHLVRLPGDEDAVILAVHHIVADGWSIAILGRELEAAYRAALGGRRLEAGPPLQCADIAVWERAQLAGEELARLRAQWKAALAGVPALSLPATDRPLPAEDSGRGASRGFVLDAELVAGLEALARAHGTTLFVILLDSLAALLHRQGAGRDLVIGTPVANRDRTELEEVVGFLVNTVPIRLAVELAGTAETSLARTRDRVAAAMAHSALPFEQIVDVVQPPRHLGHHPIFQVMLALQNLPDRRRSTGNLPRTGCTAPEPCVARFALGVFFGAAGGDLIGSLEYATDVFDHARMALFLEAYRALLVERVRTPARPLAELVRVTAAEQALIESWEHGPVVAAAANLVDPVLAFAAAHPERPAVAFGDDIVTFRELVAQARAVAAELGARGLGAEDRVAICVERGPWLGPAVLGVLCAGAACVPIDAALPPARIRFLLDDARVAAVLTGPAHGGRIAVEPAVELRVDRLAGAASRPELRPDIRPGQLAYVIYTSGSTGRPKGVAMSHGALAQLVAWQATTSRPAAAARTAHFAPLGFDVAFQELFATWSAGGCVVIIPDEVRADPAALARLLAARAVTRVFLPPLVLRELAAVEPAGLVLEEIITAGEALHVTPAIAAMCRQAGIALINQYGPSETHVATWHELGPAAERWPAWPPIGAPIAGHRAYVLDEQQARVPIGVPGELYLAGAGLARGYLARPQLTAAQFVPDPYGPPGSRMYHTGDRARWRPDGALEFLGRDDDQVKVRGFRIELGEVEAALRAHPAVVEAVAMVRPTPGGDRTLAGWVELREPLTSHELRGYLRQQLPSYMVPDTIAVLDRVPRSPNGKVDRAALPAAIAAPVITRPPATELERRILSCWSEILGAALGVDDDFFASGGNSLLVMRLTARLRAELGAEVAVRLVFEAPTVALLARRLEGVVAAASAAAVAVAAGPVIEAAGQLSFAQERLWFLDRMSPGASTYHVGAVLRFSGEADLPALAAAWAELADRHPALRTRFAVRDGQPEQIIEPSGALAIAAVTLDEVPASMREAELARIRARERARGFDLVAAPPVRAVLVVQDAVEHALIVTLHHILVDGWSLVILEEELRALYDRRRGRPAPRLPAAPPPYHAYARRTRAALDGPALAAELAFWRGELAGAPLELALPLDRPRTSDPTGPGAVQAFVVPDRVRDRLLALARDERATAFMVLLAAFSALLARYTGEGDVVVGAPIANRSHADFERTIGFFVNTVVLRARFGGAASFRELVRQVRERTLAALAHQELPFERLVEELHPERDPGVHPLFQVMVFFDDLPATPPAAPATPPATPAPDADDDGVLRFEPADAKFDLSLGLSHTAAGLVGAVEYRSDRFAHRTIWRMTRYFLRLLEAVVAAPDRPLAGLALDRGDELAGETIARDRSGAPTTLVELVAAAAHRHPERIAIEGHDAISYGELAAQVTRVAGHLRRRGVRPGDLVAIAVPRGPEHVIALLGVLAAGAAYVPIDAAMPSQRSDAIRARARWTIAGRGEPATDPAGDTAIALAEALAEPAGDGAWARVAPDAAAYVLYTSGSTGTPRGVVVEHRSAAAYARAAAEAFGLDATSRVLQFASPAVDVAVEEIFATLCAGATLVVRSDAMLDSTSGFLATCRALRLTTLILPTAYWHELVPELAFTTLPDAVRCVVIGGEQASAERLAAWHAAVGARVRLVNAYGPTETTVSATYAELSAPDADWWRPPIGRPAATAVCRVLDGALTPVPIGLPGELCVGGVAVARGYLDDPAGTAARFVPDPWGPPGSRMYRTGDRVRRRGDGALEFLGRIDGQIKVRGFRVELAEVESALRAQPGVIAAAAALRAGRGDLVAAVTAAAPLDERALRAELAAVVPGYMVPARIAVVDALPVTISGKIDQRRIVQLCSGEPEQITAPRTPREHDLAAIWAEVLRVPAVGIHDDFFALGGHSLLAAQVVARIRDRLDLELSIRRLFELRTIAALAASLPERTEAPAPPGAPAAVVVPARAEAGPALASFAQERLWFIDRLEPGVPLYNLPLRIDLPGAVNAAALRRALGWLLDRHEVLRTRFAIADGRPVQVVDATPADPLVVVDLRDLAPAQRGPELERVAEAEARQSFDLERGPLCRAVLVRVRDDDHVLLVTTHHIVSDGWSLAVLRRELTLAYEDLAAGRPPERPPPAMQYRDVAAWQRARLAGERLDELLAWWRRELSGAPRELPLPCDRPRPSVRDHEGRWQALVIPAPVVRRLEALARRRLASPFMILLAAFAALLQRWTGARELVIGVPVAGRELVAAEELIGFFVNTLAVRVAVPNASFDELLRQVQTAWLGAMAHQELPFEKLVEEIQPERSLAMSPVFQVVLAFQDLPASADRRGGDAPDDFVGTCVAKYDLTLSIERDGDRLVGYVEYATDLLDDATVRRIRDGYLALLAAAVTDPALPLGELPAASATDLEELRRWREGTAPDPSIDLVAAIERWSRVTPHAIAVGGAAATLTYAELWSRAGGLAARLRALGAGPGQPVVLVLPRSPALVVASLGSLLAGAPYVPLDPAYPAERIAYILRDVGARVLVAAEPDAALGGGAAVITLPLDGGPRGGAAPPRPSRSRTQIAYIIYTSGSTGAPKGVAIPLGALEQLCGWHRDRIAIDHRDRTTLVASPGFDAAISELWPALAAGARIEIPDHETRTSPAQLAAWLAGRQITLCYLPTPLAEAFFDVPPPRELRLRWLLTGGDRLSRSPPAGAPYRLLNQYGPTECTVCATGSDVAPGSLGMPTIGVPITGVRIEILDDELRRLPPGAAGEIVIAGTAVGLGYWQRPALTAGRFVPDPWGPPGTRMYRTGDRGRWRHGELEFHGRSDRQVKLRGLRIELGEIEHAITRACGAPAAVVLRSSEVLVGFVARPELDPAELLVALRRWLPAYMVPGHIVPVAALPLTPHGKVDVGALSVDLGEELPQRGLDAVEQELAPLWHELLPARLPRPGDDFFASGGHSLLLTQLAARVRAAFGVELPLRTLFEAVTFERMAFEILVRLLENLPAHELERMLAPAGATDA